MKSINIDNLKYFYNKIKNIFVTEKDIDDKLNNLNELSLDYLKLRDIHDNKNNITIYNKFNTSIYLDIDKQIYLCNVASPLNNYEAANKKYVDDSINKVLGNLINLIDNI